jgi:hypothetical protein|tara:strand:- start:13 stop:168 length:156 start_codon:yes stop_codon:yes gene_type:complete
MKVILKMTFLRDAGLFGEVIKIDYAVGAMIISPSLMTQTAMGGALGNIGTR